TIVNLWEADTGKFVRSLTGNLGSVWSMDFSSDGRRLLAGNFNGTSAVWDVGMSDPLALTSHALSGEWLTITPEGFFTASSPKAGQTLSIVKGFQLYAIEQVYQSLFHPDMVREKLAGDPDGEVKRTAESLSLARVIDSGQPPLIKINSPVTGA